MGCGVSAQAATVSTDETEREDNRLLSHVKQQIGEVRSLLQKIDTAKREINEECESSDDLLYTLASVSEKLSLSFGQDVPFDIVQKYDSEVCKLVVGSCLLELCCDITVQCYARNQKGLIFSSNIMHVCTTIICNLTDNSEEISERVTNYPGFLETLKMILHDTTNEKQDELLGGHRIFRYVGIIANLAMGDSSIIAKLRSLDFTSVLRPYLTSSSEFVPIVSLFALAGIVNEKESEIINANRLTVKKQLVLFQMGLENEHRRFMGFSCRKLAKVVRMLARNDANKRLLVELGAMEVLVILGKIGNDDEKTESTGAIWALCFDAENRKKVVSEEEPGVVDLLIELNKSKNNGIMKNCQGALWTLREDLQASTVERYRNLKVQSRKKEHEPRQTGTNIGETENTEGGHIMISYQWGDQPTMKSIVEILKANKFKVWIDIEKMVGSTLEAMARAIEEASVVLICFSRKYKNSENCQAEAEYAFQTKKTIVPLKMERGYVPDGWLGIIIGSKKFYEFSPKYPFKDKVNDLIKRLYEIYGRNENPEDLVKKEEPSKSRTVQAITQSHDDVDSGVNKTTRTASVSMTTASVDMEIIEKVWEWDARDVERWIRENDLTGCNMDHLTGGEIALLLCMRVETPDCFYKTLLDMLNVNNLLTMSKIVRALKDLCVKKLK